MDTPILDLLWDYRRAGTARFHMPGHKGRGPLGCEGLDITEIKGADALYEAGGIIAQSEQNAAALFGSGRTLYATEGSSQCIRAMVHLAVMHRPAGAPPVILAARNVHRAFVYAAALEDIQVEWLWPEESRSLCACPVTAEGLVETLDRLPAPPAAVYVTSPDYLGGVQDIAALAAVCHERGARLLVDNAHGAYLHFLERPCHPLDLGADLVCDSAHKTLPVLTGGAYLHLSRALPPEFSASAKTAMALFGSTSPSYLTLASLDACNAALAGEGAARIRAAARALDEVKAKLSRRGWAVSGDEPLKLTLAAPSGWTGGRLAGLLRSAGIEPEYADGDWLVLMVSGETTAAELRQLEAALGTVPEEALRRPAAPSPLPRLALERVCSIRQAVFSPAETISVENALGRVCASPVVACPPAIPIAVSGERLNGEALAVFRRYGVEEIAVVQGR